MIQEDENIEDVLRDAAQAKFMQGQTYQNTTNIDMRDTLLNRYTDWVVDLYLKAPDHRKPEILEQYGIENIGENHETTTKHKR